MYTIEKLSVLTGKSQKTIRRHIAAGTLKANKTGGKWLVEKVDYIKWLKSSEELMNKKESDSIFEEQQLEVIDTSPEFLDIKSSWKFDAWKNSQETFTHNFIDLFSGAGGLSLGFLMAGFEPLASVEIMEQAVETYKYNFERRLKKQEYVESRDIRQKSIKDELYKKISDIEVDVICGGFPCQGFSMAGNRVITDDRNTLYLDMLEIVRNIRPKFVVMENVEGLRSMLDGGVERKIVADFHQIGYDLKVATLNSADYYVPQIRKRVILIGNRIGKKSYHPSPLLNPKEYVTLGEAIADLQNLEDNKQFNHVRTRHSDEMRERLNNVPEGKSLYGNYSDAWKKSPWNKPSCTIKENHGGVNIHPNEPRVITAREMARLQSFPDDFIFKGSKKWQLVQIGNAVPPLMGKAIALAVKSQLKSD